MIQRCLALAQGGLGHVAPNPMVGAVVTCNGEIIGEGFHHAYGGPHAEVFAIDSVRDKALLAHSSLYVSLEPCCHFGKTPPCTELILKHRISRVVVGCSDIFKEVAGKGIAQLKEAGVEVTCGVLEAECLEFNRRFFTFHGSARPYLILKWAQTEDGFVAREDRSSKWISCEASRQLVHQWRSQESAIMVGTTTALLDDPQLTVRHVAGPDPLRIVFDRRLRLPRHLHLFDGAVKTLIFSERRGEKGSENLVFEQIEFGEHTLENALAALQRRKILSCIVEGGAALLNSFIVGNLWDEARVFICPQKFGAGVQSPAITQQNFQTSKVGVDELRVYRNKLHPKNGS